MGVPAPASTAEAVDMVLAGLRYLAAADPAALAAEAQAECLRRLEQADAIATAARWTGFDRARAMTFTNASPRA